MVLFRRFSNSRASATTARQRLWADSQMRCTRPAAASAPPATSFAVCALPHDRLSPAEQKQQALRISQTFKFHYLAGIDYLADRQMTVAVVRPAAQRHDTAYTIAVDAAGNVAVSADRKTRLPVRWWALHLALWMSAFIGTVLGALSFVI